MSRFHGRGYVHNTLAAVDACGCDMCVEVQIAIIAERLPDYWLDTTTAGTVIAEYDGDWIILKHHDAFPLILTYGGWLSMHETALSIPATLQ